LSKKDIDIISNVYNTLIVSVDTDFVCNISQDDSGDLTCEVFLKPLE